MIKRYDANERVIRHTLPAKMISKLYLIEKEEITS